MEKNKVNWLISTDYGYLSECQACDYKARKLAGISRQEIRNLAKNHASETGHTVKIKYGGEIQYSVAEGITFGDTFD